jgi:hypothetical protein
VLQGKAKATGPAESLQLAQFCRHYKRYLAAAHLYADALDAQPGLPEKLTRGQRYPAACAAVLAAAGQGQDAEKLAADDRAKLRRRALDWLRADHKKLARQAGDGTPAEILRAIDQLSHWQGNADLGSVREERHLDKLSLQERQDWRKLWAEVRRLSNQADAYVTEVRWEGVLTANKKEQVCELRLQKGKTYAFDLQSPQFDAYLRLLDATGKTLAENDDVEPGVKPDARVVWTAPADGTYRLIATSLGQQGTGSYTLILREFVGPKK